ncbi:uncharacterized protein CCOS01_15305, partial [Colletotrichum costaricense]
CVTGNWAGSLILRRVSQSSVGLFNQRRPFGVDSSSSSSSYQCLSDRLHKVKAIGSAPGKRHNRPFVMQTSPLQNMDHPCDRVLSVACWSKQDPSGISLDPFSPLFAPSGTPPALH